MFLTSRFIGLTLLFAAVYIGGGLAYNTSRRGVKLGAAALPHKETWSALIGLVEDGLAVSKAAVLGKSYATKRVAVGDQLRDRGSTKAGGSIDAHSSGTSKRSSPKGKSKRLKAAGRGSSSDGKTKVTESHRKEPLLQKHEATAALPTSDSSLPPVAASGWTGSTASLAEHRDTSHVHSSQARVKVVVANAGNGS